MKIKKNGFTLIEVLLVMAIMAATFLFSSFIFARRQPLTQLNVATSEMLAVLRQAQNQSLTRKASSSWGVYFDETDNSIFTLYAGNNYLDRSIAYDINFDMGESIGWSLDSTTNDIAFSPINGFAIATATIAVKHTNFADSKFIVINEIAKIERND